MNIIRRRVLVMVVAALGIGAGAPDAGAGERRLSGDEIRAALAGNTVDGEWGAACYRQYFDPGGATVYVEADKTPTRGTWWTTEDRYCSRWGGVGGSSCYVVRRDGDRIIWVVPEIGRAYPSTLLEGRRLD